MVLHNGTYEVTGGQPIPGPANLDFAGMARAAGIAKSHDFPVGSSGPVPMSRCSSPAADAAGSKRTIGTLGPTVSGSRPRLRPSPVLVRNHAAPTRLRLSAPCRAIAQATCSRTISEGSSRRRARAAVAAGEGGALPSATAMFRSHRS